MKEYGIYIKNGIGRPYMIDFYKSIDSAKLAVFDIVSLEEKRGRHYFVDNDYFKNKYQYAGNLKYICIKEREVSEWKNYSQSNEAKFTNNKIIYLTKYN